MKETLVLIGCLSATIGIVLVTVAPGPVTAFLCVLCMAPYYGSMMVYEDMRDTERVIEEIRRRRLRDTTPSDN